MRIEFFSRLALLVVSAFLVVATQAWAASTIEWLFIAGGVAMLAIAGVAGSEGSRRQRALTGIVALLGVWAVVAAVVFTGSTLTWVAFATALAAGMIAIVGLIDHETSTERVVHELQVTPAPARRGAYAA